MNPFPMRPLAAAICLAAAAMPAAQAQSRYPEKSVRLIVPFAPAGGTDISARILAQKLSETMGHSFVVDNRPGAGSVLGTEIAARSPPDGYTIIQVAPEFTVNPSLQSKLPYDTLRDFTPIVRVVYGQYFMTVRRVVNINTVKDLIAATKTSQVTYGSSGTGSANHLAGELFKTMAGVDMVHVPYKGSGPSMTALLAGEVTLTFGSSTAVIPHVKSGRAKVIAVTGPQRSAIAPDVPTVSESGLPGFEVTGWYGLLGPARMPRAIVMRLNEQVNKVLPDLKERYAEMGTEPAGGSPEQFAQFIRTEIEKWSRVVKSSGAKPEG